MEHFLELFVNVVLKVGLPLIECSIKVIECRLKNYRGQKERRCVNSQENPALICPPPHS